MKPEDTLYAVTAEAMGLPTLDESVFLEEIASVTVMEKNTLRFVFKDGSETTVARVGKPRYGI